MCPRKQTWQPIALYSEGMIYLTPTGVCVGGGGPPEGLAICPSNSVTAPFEPRAKSSTNDSIHQSSQQYEIHNQQFPHAQFALPHRSTQSLSSPRNTSKRGHLTRVHHSYVDTCHHRRHQQARVVFTILSVTATSPHHPHIPTRHLSATLEKPQLEKERISSETKLPSN